ncbi:phytanoyl-CoA dioxygenase family protein [Anianabacter salinae]|uniref:hypothetical protein n=1 Tax=Anianabacter salinae TaxID=2851023 RepID=UPI00225DF0E9|nr:hypothetical protein [Anianabacter salinae]MBV0914175.1 hypothetical protein [Anianabacter salinae]
MIKTALERLARVNRSGASASTLSDDLAAKLVHLKTYGYVQFDHWVGSPGMAALQADYLDRLENKLEFEMPTLAQSRVDRERDADLIASNFLATTEQLAARGLTFDRGNVTDYAQAVREFEPSTLKVYLPDTPAWMQMWLDPQVLSVVEAYMGFRPELTEAYLRRNYPSKFVVMNHAWHRDRNHETHLLKAFFFLSDCTLKTGPHHYIAGSIKNRTLDGRPYFTNEEVATAYDGPDTHVVVSEVPAGTFILEDTRGLHKAGIPEEGYRDLGFATFLPPIALRKRTPLYHVSHSTASALSPQQQAYIPAGNITK